jgi:hypothetical protein
MGLIVFVMLDGFQDARVWPPWQVNLFFFHILISRRRLVVEQVYVLKSSILSARKKGRLRKESGPCRGKTVMLMGGRFLLSRKRQALTDSSISWSHWEAVLHPGPGDHPVTIAGRDPGERWSPVEVDEKNGK